MIAIIDYGAGNLHSVKNALDFLGAESVITSDAEQILNADKVILPGVGAFGDAMMSIREKGLESVIKKTIENKTPFLGICLGLQLLFEESEESPGISGLGIFKGKIVKIVPMKPFEPVKIPHIGWNDVRIIKESRILKGFDKLPYAYYVHSYYLEAEDTSIVSAFTNYGRPIGVAVEQDNVFATQFHPEKSGATGLKILKNFIEL